jgi:hypothetical protein
MTVIHPPLHVTEPGALEEKPWTAPKTEAEAIEAILSAQRTNGDATDPAGARKFVRMLIAVGMFKPT